MSRADIQAPDRVFGFFTITAGLDVLGVRLALAGHPLATAILVGVAAAVWLVLTYGVPAGLLLTRAQGSVLGGNPLSERKLAQMFGRTSRRCARARIVEAQRVPSSRLPGDPAITIGAQSP